MVELRRKLLKFFIFEIMFSIFIIVLGNILLSSYGTGVMSKTDPEIVQFLAYGCIVTGGIIFLCNLIGTTPALEKTVIITKNELDEYRETTTGIYMEYDGLCKIFRYNMDKIKKLKTIRVVYKYGLTGTLITREFKLSLQLFK